MPQSVDMGIQINPRANGDKDTHKPNGEHRDSAKEHELEFDDDGDCPFDLKTEDMDSVYQTESFNSLRRLSGVISNTDKSKGQTRVYRQLSKYQVECRGATKNLTIGESPNDIVEPAPLQASVLPKVEEKIKITNSIYFKKGPKTRGIQLKRPTQI